MIKRLLIITLLVIASLLVVQMMSNAEETQLAALFYGVIAINILACLIGLMFNPYFTFKKVDKTKFITLFLLCLMVNMLFYSIVISPTFSNDFLGLTYPFNISILYFLLSFIFFRKSTTQ